MELHRASHAHSQGTWTTEDTRSSRDPKRNLLRPKERLPMAPASPRLPSVAHRLPLFFQDLADRRHLGEDQPDYPRTATGSLGQRSAAQGGRSGLPLG